MRLVRLRLMRFTREITLHEAQTKTLTLNRLQAQVFLVSGRCEVTF